MKKLWTIVSLVLCILLAGCSNIGNSETFVAKAYTSGPKKVPERGLLYVEALYGTKVLYQESGNTTADITFYTYDFETDETKEIGYVPNFALQSRNYAHIGDTYYFYITVNDESGTKNVLYATDLSKGKMYQVSENRYWNKMISLMTIDEEIYALQADMVDGITEVFLERIDKKGRTEEIEIYREDSDTETLLMCITSDDNTMYALERNDLPGNDPAEFRLFFSKYDSDFSRVYTTEITDIYNGLEYEGYPMSGGIAYFCVFGNYFYMIDYSGSGVICEFNTEHDTVEVLFYDEALEHIKNFGNRDCEYFRIRNTNDIFRLDTKNGEIVKQNYDTGDENSFIWSALAYDDELLIMKRPTENFRESEMWYLVPTNENR